MTKYSHQVQMDFLNACLLKRWMFLGCSFLSISGCSPYFYDPSQSLAVSCCPGEEWPPDFNKLSDHCSIDDSQPMPLMELIYFGLSNHPAIRTDWARARAQAYAVEAAKSAYYPAINGSISTIYRDIQGGGTLNSIDNNLPSTPDTDLDNTGIPNMVLLKEISLSYLLLDFGGRESSVNSAKYLLNALNWTQNRTIQTVLINILQSYYNYMGAQELLQAKQQDLKNAEVNLTSTQVRFEAGVGTKLDVLQALSNRENVHLELTTAKNEVHTQLGNLATALSLPANATLNIENLPEVFPKEELSPTVNDLIDLAKSLRPDLSAAYSYYLQAKEEAGIAFSAGMPTLTTSSVLQWSQYPTQSISNSRAYSTVATLNIPIFNGFLYRQQMREAEEIALANYSNYENLESLAILDVVTSYYQFSTAQENLKYSLNYLNYSEQAYQLALANYQAGTGSFLDLLTAQNTLTNARVQRIQARTGWATALFNVSYSTGTLNTYLISQKLAPAEHES